MRPYRIALFLAVIILGCVLFAQPIQPVFMWFTDLTDTPGDYIDDIGKVLAVSDANTIEFITIGTGVGDMLKSTYDVAEDDFVDANDTIYASSWNGTINAASMNAIYDYLHLIDTDDDGDVDNVDSGASPFGASIDDTELTAEDFGDFTSDGGEDGVTLDVNVVAAAELMSGDYGDIVIDGAGAMTLDVNTVAASELLSGDYGDVTIDGAGVITVDADSIALTTDTTGNYVLSITNGAGITGGDGGSEGAALTIAATLGTAIDTTEITDNTIEIADMNMLNAPADEDILVYDDATGGGFKGQTISEILNPTGDSYWLVGTAAGAWQWESGATARTSIGLGLSHGAQFAGLTSTGGLVSRYAGTQLVLRYDPITNWVDFEVDADGDIELDSNKTGYVFDVNDGSITIGDANYIGSASDTDAIQIEADGDVVLTQKLGIGVTPTANAHISDSASGFNNLLMVKSTDTGGAAGAARIRIEHENSKFVVNAYSSGAPGSLADSIGFFSDGSTTNKFMIGHTGTNVGNDIYFFTNNLYSNPQGALLQSGRWGYGTITPQGTAEWKASSPYLYIHNSSHEDTDGSRESRLIFRGEQSGGEETSLGQIEVSHDGAADNQLGRIILSVNTGAGLAEGLRVDSNADVDVVNDFTAGTIQADNGVSGTLVLDDGATERVTLVFTGGILTSRTVAATVGALIDWTD